VDGARLWNAAVAQNVSPASLVQSADSVSVCLSKGLGAPVGSLVAGSEEFIHRARRNRKVLGGGMRQAGVIAAAGVVAVTEMVERLADDHAHARRLAYGLSELDGVELVPESVKTNIVFFDLVREDILPAEFAALLAGQNVLVSPSGGRRLRAVTNHHVTDQDVETAIAAARSVLEGEVVDASQTSSAYA
jgi:threonine aldolase